jgi:hypothetical protein
MAGIDRDRIDPEFLMDLADPVGRIYEAIERDILVNIARRFKGGSPSVDYLAWDARMLAQLGALTEENRQIILSYMRDADAFTEIALRTSLDAALNSIEPELAKIVVKPDYVPTRTQMVEQIMTSYKAQALNTRNMVNTVMLNSSLQVYRQTVSAVSTGYEAKLARAQMALNEETGAVATGAKTRQEAVRDAVRKMADDGLTGFQDRKGRTWSPQAYVNMDVRTTTANIANEATLKRNEDYGNHVIAISSHIGARPKCEPYQGKLYSTDGTSGTVKDLRGNEINYTPLSGTSYGEADGIFGINCGHRPYPFIDGVSTQTFKPYDKAQNAKQYENSQTQRYMERKVRKAKTNADVYEAAGDAEGAKAERKKARAMNAELKAYCVENKLDYKPDRVSIVRPKKP